MGTEIPRRTQGVKRWSSAAVSAAFCAKPARSAESLFRSPTPFSVTAVFRAAADCASRCLSSSLLADRSVVCHSAEGLRSGGCLLAHPVLPAGLEGGPRLLSVGAGGGLSLLFWLFFPNGPPFSRPYIQGPAFCAPYPRPARPPSPQRARWRHEGHTLQAPPVNSKTLLKQRVRAGFCVARRGGARIFFRQIPSHTQIDAQSYSLRLWRVCGNPLCLTL